MFKEARTPIPNNFNALIILNVMHVLFTTQESLAITTSLYFWYEFCNLFDAEMNAFFLTVMVKYYFFKLGMHWSKSVREGFFYFVCFKALMMYENGVGNAVFDSTFLTINQYLNVAKVAGELYGQRVFSVERLPKKERRKTRMSDVKAAVIQEVEALNRQSLNQNFMTTVPKFSAPFQKYLATGAVPNDYYASKDHKAFQVDEAPVNEGDEEEYDFKNTQTIRYLRFTSFNPETLLLSHIGMDEIQYAALGVQEFRTQLSNFMRMKAEHPGLTIDQLPKLKMRLPIDEFEFIEDSEAQW